MPSPPSLKKLIVFLLLLLSGVVPTLPAAADIDLPREGEILVAVVLSADLPRYRKSYEAFLAGADEDPALRKRLKIFLQVPNPDPFSWENSVRRAPGAGADLLLTFGTPATLAARKEVPRLPLIYGDVFDPTRLNLEKDPHSLSDGVAGISSRLPMTTLLKTFLKIDRVRKIGTLFSKNERGSVLQIEELGALAGKTGFRLIAEDILSGTDIDDALTNLETSRIDALYLTESAIVGLQSAKIIAWCRERRIPVISHVPGLAEQGAILCLEIDPAEQGKILARCVSGLARGDESQCKGILKPRHADFLINLSVAREYGLTVPFQALTLATRVIRGEDGSSSNGADKAGR